VNQQIIGLGDDINGLLTDIAKLNVQIAEAEGGSVSPSDAVGLRDRRAEDLAKLAEITDIHSLEQPTGDVTVLIGGEYLVSLGQVRKVKVVTSTQDNLQVSEIRIADLDAPITSGSGRLGGLIAARDGTLKGFLNDLDSLSKTLIGEFNKIYSGGQGLSGFTQIQSQQSVANAGAALDAAGLPFTPTNGLFQVQVYNSQTNQRTTTDIRVDLNGLDSDTSLNDLAAQLDAIDGIGATITTDGKLQITGDSPQVSFAFANDTSGTLAALGLNTFFTGTRASDIGINQDVRSDATKFAISAGGVGQDTTNGALLANLLTAPLDSHDGASLANLYDQLTGNVAQSGQSVHAAAEGLRHFQQTLEAQHMAVSGVNIDEEAVRLIEYQRAFQASAKVIATVNELLDTLLKL
jgi:flagellar hook-associated protein 1 FlgK